MESRKSASYTIGKPISYDQVPNWARRPPKWEELIKMIDELEPGQTLPVTFPHPEEAIRARNTVRDTLNRERGVAVIRTRLVNANGETIVYFTLLP